MVVWLQILRHVCTKAFVKFHLTHAIAIRWIVNAAYCLILYLLARKQQQNSSLSLNKEFLKAAKVISTTISAILAPSANKMDHLQLIRIQTSRVPAGVNAVPVVRQCCCCKKKQPATSGDGGGGYDKGSGGLERWIWGGAPEETALLGV